MLRAARGGARWLLRGELAPAPAAHRRLPPRLCLPRRLLHQAPQPAAPPPAVPPPAVGRWLLACSGAVAGAVVLGGVTR